MVPWGRWGGILGDFGAPGRSQDALGHQERNSKVGFLAKTVAPRIDCGPQLRRQGGQKSNFFATNGHEIAKKSLQEGFQKKIEK